MKRLAPPLLAAAPGLLLIAVSLAGMAPRARDLPDYFAPMRLRLGEVLAGARSPLWNPDTGCGEPFFANPQTGVAYPAAWLAAALPPSIGVGVEAGLHLAWLAAGCALLARRLGAGAAAQVAAGWAAVFAGPVLSSVGVLNNLDTIAWLPWLWEAAIAAALPRVALAGAAAWLAAEPTLAVLGALIAIALVPTRRTVAALALAGSLVAVQALPFAAWVRDGDRGPGASLEETSAGGLHGDELPAIVVPGVELAPRPDRFVPSLTLPLWVVAMAGIALASRRPQTRRLALAGWVLAALAALPAVPGGETLWRAVTLGLVRFPGRLLFVTAVALPVAAVAALGERRLTPRWAWFAAAAAVAVSVAAGGSAVGSLVGGVAAGAVLTGVAAAPAALAGAVALAPFTVPVLAVGRAHAPEAACLVAQQVGRFYAVPPSRSQLAWIAGDEGRRVSLGLGTTALLDGRRAARSFSPVISRPLARHLAEADRGPVGRWWLDALAARRVVAHHELAGFSVVCRDQGLVVADNPLAWAEASFVRALPRIGEAPSLAGRVTPRTSGDGERFWEVDAGSDGMLLLASAPDRGWRFSVDGSSAEVVRGPGILHGVTLSAGRHVVRARYIPPGMIVGATISLAAAAFLVVARRRRW